MSDVLIEMLYFSSGYIMITQEGDFTDFCIENNHIQIEEDIF